MAEIKKSNEAKDYKERFEFRLTVGDNIICQRYFKINNVNPASLSSMELRDAIRECVNIIDNDLREKTHIYLETYVPRYFDSVDEMNTYFKNAYNRIGMRYGEGLVVRNSDVDYFWGDNGPEVCSYKYDDGEFTRPLTNEDYVTYKFSFLIDEVEVSFLTWTGIYPKYIRNSIDLSNKRGKFEGEDLSRLNFEQYLLYKLVENRGDLVWGIIKTICNACSKPNSRDYTREIEYDVDSSENSKKVVYKNRTFDFKFSKDKE